MQADSLIVPIHLSALPIPKAGTRLTALQLSMLKLEQRNAVASMPKESATIEVAKPAVLLHWVLPAYFKQGKQTANGFEFPSVPNRWLVVRSHTEGERVVLKKWVVESNYYTVATKDSESNHLLETSDGMQVIQLGRKVELRDGTPYQEAAPSNYLSGQMAAVAGWDPAFAAKFGSAENVFGMRDEFEGSSLPVLKDLSYQVFGWYSEPTHDLLAQAMLHAEKMTAEAKVEAPKDPFGDFLAHAGWEYSATDEAPQGILCHALLQGIDTSGKTASNIPTQTQVYVANSAVEAAGSYLSHQKVMSERWAGLLDQYQYAMIEEQGWPFDPKEFLEKKQHNHGFQSVGGGTHFAVKVQKKDSQQGFGPEAKEQSPAFVFPQEITDRLRQLNKDQSEKERLEAAFQSTANDLFAKSLIHQLPEHEQPDDAAVGELFPRSFEPLRVHLSDLAKLQSRVHAQTEGLYADFGKLNAAKESTVVLELVSVADQRFWKPNEPTVLITGLRPSAAYSNQNVNGRDTRQLATSFVYKDASIALPPSTELGVLGEMMPENVIRALWRESKLFNPAYFPQVASDVARQMGILANDLLEALKANWASWNRESSTFQRPEGMAQPDRFEYLRWQMPWVPMYMDWEIEFAFPRSIDDEKDAEALSGVFNGRCLLSSVIAQQITQIEEALGMPRSTEAVLFQELSGLSDQFLSRLDGLQLPLFDLNAKDTQRRHYKLLHNEEVALMGTEHPWGPILGDGIFSLVRAGRYALKNITVIDAFGQSLKVYDATKPAPIPSQRLRMDASTRYLQMPLQLNFGARLKMEWIDARSPQTLERSNSDPQTSPIFGWLVLQHGSQHLAVYASDGQEMGELMVREGKVAFEASVPDGIRLKAVHETLNRWLRAMRDKSPAELQALVAGIAAYTADARRPSSKASRREIPALPTGLPLALARLHCRLERQEQQIHNYRFSQRPSTIALETLAFPFQPGNSSDGVLYYSLDPEWRNVQAGKSFLKAMATGPTEFPLQFVEGKDDAMLYLLLDPQKPVEISSSILPTQTTQLDEAYVKRGLSTMEHKVQVRPLLTPAAAVTAPLPDLAGTRWEWNSMPIDAKPVSGEVEISKVGKASFEPILAKDIQFKIIQEEK